MKWSPSCYPSRLQWAMMEESPNHQSSREETTNEYYHYWPRPGEERFSFHLFKRARSMMPKTAPSSTMKGIRARCSLVWWALIARAGSQKIASHKLEEWPFPSGGAIIFVKDCAREIGFLLIDIFRRYFNPPIKATPILRVALLFCRINRKNLFVFRLKFNELAVLNFCPTERTKALVAVLKFPQIHLILVKFD